MKKITSRRVDRFSVFILVLLITLVVHIPASGQSAIPPGSWRYHLSYNNVQSLEVSTANIYAATTSGVLVYDRTEKALHTFNKLNGLTSTGITALRYDNANGQLLIAYADGTLDFIKDNTITSFSRLKGATVSGPKQINHISIHKNVAYLSTSYGVVVFDLVLHEIKETWRDLGIEGERLAVSQTAILNDSIFIATTQGILAGNLADNLLDYRRWKRFNTGPFIETIPSITAFNHDIYATGRTGVYRYHGGTWSAEPFLQNKVIVSLAASGQNLILIEDSTVWAVNTSGISQVIEDQLITSPAVAMQDETGLFWIGDRLSGLVSNTSGVFASYMPNGPALSTASRMVYDDGKLFALGGGVPGAGQPLKDHRSVSIFENGVWTTQQESFGGVTDVAQGGGYTYMSTFGSGLVLRDGTGNTTIFDEMNSPLTNSVAENSSIPAIAMSTEGLWVLNYGGDQSLHLLKNDLTWASFSFTAPNGRNPVDIAVDRDGLVWMILNPLTGGGLLSFDAQQNVTNYKTSSVGSGGLPNKFVHDLVTDLNGYTWVGTESGVAYFFSPREDAIIPIFENRFLLRDEEITAIDVDGGNRKWIGTEQGVWLFNATGETLIHNFTIDNSPLLSNAISEIEINDDTGEVFFSTDQGIVSYQSDAITAGDKFKNVKVYPNPVMANFAGVVGISGLANNSTVKITDVSGNLVWQSQANGGMTTWNVKDYNGRRLTTGVYLIFAASSDGSESMVGKIAVVE